MKKLILSVAVCLSATVSAQQFKVVSLQEVNSGTRLSNKFWAVSFYSFNRLKNKLKK